MYNDHYVKRNGSEHNSYCACGAYIIEQHELEWYIDPNWDDSQLPRREKQCKQCLYIKVIKDLGGGNIIFKEEEYDCC